MTGWNRQTEVKLEIDTRFFCACLCIVTHTQIDILALLIHLSHIVHSTIDMNIITIKCWLAHPLTGSEKGESERKWMYMVGQFYHLTYLFLHPFSPSESFAEVLVCSTWLQICPNLEPATRKHKTPTRWFMAVFSQYKYTCIID